MKKTVYLAALLTLAVGCDARPPLIGDVDAGNNSRRDGQVSGFDGHVSRPDAAAYDPFDPANACGLSTIPTTQVPGTLMIVFDRSGSMGDAPSDSGPSKWELATSAIDSVLTPASLDDLSAGLMLFPSDGDCGAPSTPDVAIAELSTNRSVIHDALAGTGPGGNTPAFHALLSAYDYLHTLSTSGQLGVVLVTDGGESCNLDEADSVMARVQMEHDTRNILTFAVGLDYADNNLSTIAYNGGTPRNSTCMPTCTSGSCLTDADCGGTARCVTPPGLTGVAGFCSCGSDGDCVGMQTCETPSTPCFGLPPEWCDLLNAPQCQGPTDCCHYNAAASDFQAQFEAALGEIARRLLDSCVFDVPQGTDPSTFDPRLVNVGVTFDGESRMVLPQSSDSSMSSWDYTDSTHETLIIHGPVCDRLLSGANANVEIVLGCPTILI